MGAAAPSAPQVLHALPGRLRLHLPYASDADLHAVEERLASEPGVTAASVALLTGNLLVLFDAETTTAERLRAAAGEALSDLAAAARLEGQRTPRARRAASPMRQRPSVIRERYKGARRLRLAVRGLERDAELGPRLVQRLQAYQGVRASASPLTGRVLVTMDEDRPGLTAALLQDIRSLERPAAPDEPWPAHPLDAGPLYQAATRLGGALVALAVLALGSGRGGPGGGAVPVRAAGILSVLQGIPAVRAGLERVLGRDLAEPALVVPKIVILTFAGSPLGLVVAAAEALNLLAARRELREGWRRLEARTGPAAAPLPGERIRLEAGDRVPLPVRVLDGAAFVEDEQGLPVGATAGTSLSSGARVRAGWMRAVVVGASAFEGVERSTPSRESVEDRYLAGVGPAALLAVILTGVLTRSMDRCLGVLLLMSPRPLLTGRDAAAAAAAARATRSGAIVVATRPERALRLPDLLLLDGPRVLLDGLELVEVEPVDGGLSVDDLRLRAAAVSAATGTPWGAAFRGDPAPRADAGLLRNGQAEATLDGERLSLGPALPGEAVPASLRLRHPGEVCLALRRAPEARIIGWFVLRPAFAAGVTELLEVCRRLGVELALLRRGDGRLPEPLAERLGLVLVEGESADVIRERQAAGARVAFLSDRAAAGAGFEAADLALGLSGSTSRFHARADVLVPDLRTAAAVVDTAARHELARRDGVGLAASANVGGLLWGIASRPPLARASLPADLATMAALGSARGRLRGGEVHAASARRMADPRPERWGARGLEEVLTRLETRPEGLSTSEALARRRDARVEEDGHPLLDSVSENLFSPLSGFVGAAAALTLAGGARGDAAVMGATLLLNVLVGAWQEHSVERVSSALKRMSTGTAVVLRDGQPCELQTSEVVPGDVLVVGPGQRVAADARVLEAAALEVDEAALTGESMPVQKSAAWGSDASRVLLAGTDVVVGHGTAVVVAVGEDTRMGATAAALAHDDSESGVLADRLAGLLKQVIPVTAVGGGLVTLAGVARGRPLMQEVVGGASIALAAFPEALPVLAGMGQAAAARRLATRNTRVQRPAAVEALGRVDVACVDKTGTLTEGRLSVQVVSDAAQEWTVADAAGEALGRRILLTAALASPHPGERDATAHSTDVSVVRAAQEAGLGEILLERRGHQARFDSARPFHATVARGRLRVKGAPEVLLDRCVSLGEGDEDARPLAEADRTTLLRRSEALARQGLRVIMVADGPEQQNPEDPRGLTALGFLGIADPLRPTVPAAVERCHEAGIKVLMLTGDHPATAHAIATRGGLLSDVEQILTGADIAQLSDVELDATLERTTVVARATPLDKLRIVESLKRCGHTIAMTGDGVNDAPALRLADVGVAMGRGGTEVARQAADVVLVDDDFSSLVEALVEGRSFWRNLRRSLGLLLGGNFGELVYMIGASVLGSGAALTVRQILATNLITDALPAFAVAVQRPEHRRLEGLDREGESALGRALTVEVIRRAGATALPALGAYAGVRTIAPPLEARSVGFATIVGTQLALTLQVGRAQGTLTPQVVGAVAASGGATLALLRVPALRAFFDLAFPSALGWLAIGGGVALAPLLSSALPVPGERDAAEREAPPALRLVPAT